MPSIISAGSLASLAATTPRPGGFVDFTGRQIGYAALWRTQPAVRTVVGWLARNVATLTPRLYERRSSAERVELRDHPYALLLRYPSPGAGRHKFTRAIVSDLAIFDEAYALKFRHAERLWLIRIPYAYIEPLGSTIVGPEAYRISGPNGGRQVSASEVVAWTGYTPETDGAGSSPIEALRLRLAEELAAGEYRSELWQNGARLSGVITRPPADARKGIPAWSDTARERFEASWSARWSGREAARPGGTPVLEEGMTYHPVTMTATDLQFLETRKLTREEVAAAYHVQPGLVGIDISSDLGEQRKAAMTDSLAPLLDFIADETHRQLAPDFGLDYGADTYLEHNLEERLRGDFIDAAEVLSRSVGGPWLTRDEARSKANLPKLDGQDTDRLIVPLNVILGGRASPADTAPGTPGAGQVGQASRGAKALEDLGAYAGDATAVEDLVARHLSRQRSSVLSRLGAGQTIAEAFDLDEDGRPARFDSELADDLGAAMLEVSSRVVDSEAADLGAPDYAASVAEPWLLNNARITAEEWNARTVAAVTEAAAFGFAARTKDDDLLDLDDLDPVAAAGSAFDDRSADLHSIAAGAVIVALNFTRHDAAVAGGRGSKTWRVNSTNPRESHAALNGVTIPTRERFANGALWPGDPSLPVDEVADCTCTIEFGA